MAKKIILIIFLILFVDQSVKIWVKTSMVPLDQINHEAVSKIALNTGEPIDLNPENKPSDIRLIPNFFEVTYTENQGMAFGTKISNAWWGKLFLSLFRLLAIGAIGYYLYTIIRDKRAFGFVLAIGLIFAGAFGNLIDSMFYDFIFDIDPKYLFNYIPEQNEAGQVIAYNPRHSGFLFGNVVDMFHFTVEWPNWWPGWARIGGSNRVFPAIFNIADVSITFGVALIIIKQKSFFGKKKEPKTEDETPNDSEPKVEVSQEPTQA